MAPADPLRTTRGTSHATAAAAAVRDGAFAVVFGDRFAFVGHPPQTAFASSRPLVARPELCARVPSAHTLLGWEPRPGPGPLGQWRLQAQRIASYSHAHHSGVFRPAAADLSTIQPRGIYL
ncbi:hypothetical protein PF005_g2890 [Phytophthora fragariae]|uniref:Uncharacterized protein n=1 Tax=Phytophthora fragariae TaxID=53985 RepID=A0A6A3TD56_9STRA|nr:hypothetical protein PF009_g2136 [Phytophthora fragariae]KAE9021098.1 hypothetical protein PF011_g5104 [Phytophthora fragariae]KAE9134609.1 hypothetical protein PF007_g2869 [Phytophthora fragariae]KAE9150961.1 hypothetical protein PF006_g4699 [Phytophthora fragariae]KAE9231980.1 hypothetical protein PF005_g2890 [Phytophthora fragariae]